MATDTRRMDESLRLAQEIIQVRAERDAIDAKLGALVEKYQMLMSGPAVTKKPAKLRIKVKAKPAKMAKPAKGGKKKPTKVETETPMLVPPPSSTVNTTIPAGPRLKRILMLLREAGPLNARDIADRLQDDQRLVYMGCMDMKRRRHLLDGPHGGLWKISEAGLEDVATWERGGFSAAA